MISVHSAGLINGSELTITSIILTLKLTPIISPFLIKPFHLLVSFCFGCGVVNLCVVDSKLKEKKKGFIYYLSSPQANRYSPISPNGFPSLGVALADDEHF